jgi:hypothetical protein
VKRRFRRPSRQGCRPDFRHGSSICSCRRTRGARRLRNADDDQSRRAGRRNPRQGHHGHRWRMGPGRAGRDRAAVRARGRDIGYEQDGFHWEKLPNSSTACTASRRISRRASTPAATRMRAPATRASCSAMPPTKRPTDAGDAALFHKILEKLAADRHSGVAPFLEPDAKSQVTLRYEDGVPVKRHRAIVVSTQHAPGCPEGRGSACATMSCGVRRVLPAGLDHPTTVIYVNPTGIFEIGGPDGDAGLTGRKIIVDTYGGASPTAAAPSAARTRPRSTARPPMPPAIWPRISSPPALPALHDPAQPMPSAWPSRCRSMSTRTAPARSTKRIEAALGQARPGPDPAASARTWA